jgi:hypothetical protein
MTEVQVAWLSVVLGPIALVALICAVSARHSASRRGEPMPDWGKVAQGVAITLALAVALINMAGGRQ